MSLFYLVFVVLFAFLLGRALLQVLRYSPDRFSETLLVSLVLGLGAINVGVLVLGFTALLYKAIVASLSLLAFLLLVIFRGKKDLGFILNNLKRFRFRGSYFVWLYALLLASYALYNLMICLTPVIEGDSIAWYLSIPKFYIQNHSSFYRQITQDFISSNLPQGVFMLSTYGMILDSEILSQLLLGWLFGLLSALAVYTISRNLLNKSNALLAAGIFYVNPVFSRLILSAKIDLGYTMFELCFWAVFIRWVLRREQKTLYVSAVFLGLAMAAKYHAAFAALFSALFVLVAMLSERRSYRDIFWSLVKYTAISLLIAAPSYLKTCHFTGDPFYPFLTSLDMVDGEGYGIYSGVTGFLRFQYNTVFLKDFLVKTIPTVGGTIGFLLIMFLPFLFISHKHLNKESRGIVLICIGYYLLLSLIVFQSIWPFARHLLPAVGLLAVANGLGLQISQKWFGNSLVTALVCLISLLFITLFNYGFPNMGNKLKYLTGKLNKTEYLETALFNSFWHMNGEMLEFVNTLDHDAKIMTLDYGNAYYVNRPLVKKSYAFSDDPIDAIIEKMNSDSVTHIYYNKRGLDQILQRFNAGQRFSISKSLDTRYFKLVKKVDDNYLYEVRYYSPLASINPDLYPEVIDKVPQIGYAK